MKKTLIALALSTIPLAALADVTLYGDIKGGVEYTKVNHVDNTITAVNDWGSYIGFKGQEDLGSGLQAIWQIEQSVSLDNKSSRNDRWANRDSFIGLAGAFGTLRAGYLSDTFKSNEKLIDPWKDTNENNGVRTLGSFDRYGDRYTGVRYDSPNWGGFTFNVLYSPEDNQRYDDARANVLTSEIVSKSLDENYGGFQGLAPIVNDVTRYKDVLAVGLGYENSGWFINYGYKNARNLNADKLNGEVHGLDFGYDNGTWLAGLGYRTSRNYVVPFNAAADDIQWETNEGAVTFAYTAGNVVPRISYAYGEEKERHVENPQKNKYQQVIVGVDYNLSKRTAVLASLGYWTNKPRSWTEVRDKTTDVVRSDDDRKYVRDQERQEVYSFGLGLRHKF